MFTHKNNRHYHSQKLAGPMITAVYLITAKLRKIFQTTKKSKKMSGKTPIYDVPEALKRKILPGFTCIEHGIDAMSWSGFGWFGKLQVELDGEEIRQELLARRLLRRHMARPAIFFLQIQKKILSLQSRRPALIWSSMQIFY